MRTIAAIILAQLAASPIVACRDDTAPPNNPTPPTSVASSPSTVPSALMSAAPSTPAGRDAECKLASDCGPGLTCVLPVDGHSIIPNRPGGCRLQQEPQMGGRPLYVEGTAHVSPSRPHRAWRAAGSTELAEIDMSVEATTHLAPWRERLTRAAFEEHASVAAFARTICQLVALGAPAWLVEKTQRALGDEIRHATGTFEWVARLGGGVVGPGPLLPAVAPFEGTGSFDELAVALLRDVFRGGCVNETLAAHEAATLAREAPLGELRAFYATLADDEARHASLAFETVLWLVSETDAARCALEEERANVRVRLVEPLLEAVFG